VPLQSGSDRILRAMHRWYRADHYAERVKRIRQIVPGAAIGADVIVGFPGETQEDFQHSVELIERLPFTYLHVFSFSARPGTAGANLAAFVPGTIIRERARTLRALSQRKSSKFRASQAGRTLRALTLAGGGDTWTTAMTANYLKIRIPGRLPANQWHKICLSSDEASMAEFAGANLQE
jgi:threonylcarbamoyladenosine tRNA methylthiotransferase MtaB